MLENEILIYLGYSVYYIIFILLILFLILSKTKLVSDNLTFKICFSVLIIICCFRGVGIDRDYTTYFDSFNNIGSPGEYFTNYEELSFYEPFYYFIPSLLKLLSISWYKYLIIIIFGLIGVSLKFYGLRKISNSIFLSLLLYFSYYFFLHEMTQMRVGIATGCFLFCIYYYYKKEYYKFIIVFLIAFCFHYTSILILAILVLNRNKFRLSINLTLLIASYFVFVLRINVINEVLFSLNLPFTNKLLLVLKTRTVSENTMSTFNIPYLLSFLLTFWLFLNHKKITVENKHAPLLLKTQLLAFICWGVFSSVATVSFRLSEFFGIVSVLLFPLIVNTFRNKVLGYSIFITYCLLILVEQLHLSKLVLPYEMLFFQS